MSTATLDRLGEAVLRQFDALGVPFLPRMFIATNGEWLARRRGSLSLITYRDTGAWRLDQPRKMGEFLTYRIDRTGD